MSKSTLTHKDIAKLLGVSETTVKSYRRKFPGCIPVANQGKPIRFTQEAAAVALKIRDLFETGMSVEEVRARLAQEFSWISPEAPQDGKKDSHKDMDKGSVAPELTVGVSNMAKSMVSMAQQQKAILQRMQGIEAMLEELGIQGTVDVASIKKGAAEAAKKKEAQLEARLDGLDEATRSLSDTVASLAQELGRFMTKRERAAEEWKASGGLASHMEERNQDAANSKVIQLRPENGNRHGDIEAAPAAESRPTDPPRQLLSLPLVVRTPQGQYISAGGRGRGRFSINDLKAMLIYGFTPPHHFTLSWEPHGEGWWLQLTQAAPQESNSVALSYTLLLMELPTQRGTSVIEILQLKNGEQTVHPAEISSIINSFGEQNSF